MHLAELQEYENKKALKLKQTLEELYNRCNTLEEEKLSISKDLHSIKLQFNTKADECEALKAKA